MNITIYEVGGSLRDEYLGLTSKDKDYAVEAPSFDAMRDFIVARGAKIYVETPKYLTIRAHDALLGPQDFTLCRQDGEYIDGRHPETVKGGTILQDLERRDFTCNAMARSVETGEWLDPYDGRKDIEDRLLRAVGGARARFDEDKLRMFRALRFAVTKGFRLQHEICNAIGCYTSYDFRNVSTERIREELLKMFRKDPERSFYLLNHDFPNLWSLVMERGIWFKPTVEE